jgi:hypothetical protein
METIENCPHCGGPGKLKDIPKPFRHGWVGCPECHCYIDWKYTPADAIAKWNRRAA